MKVKLTEWLSYRTNVELSLFCVGRSCPERTIKGIDPDSLRFWEANGTVDQAGTRWTWDGTGEVLRNYLGWDEIVVWES